jgi:FkbM family methyltransferase
MKLRRFRDYRPVERSLPKRRLPKSETRPEPTLKAAPAPADRKDQLLAELAHEAALEFDASLLERARALWQAGDWAALSALKGEQIEQHPQRSKLALLVAMALHQLGRFDDAACEIKKAELWGCPRDVLARALLAGALNSVGRAHALRGRMQRASDRFSQSLAIGFPGSEHPAIVAARAHEQCLQLGLINATLTRSAALTMPTRPTAGTGAATALSACDGSHGSLDRLLQALDTGQRKLPADPQGEEDLLRDAGVCLSRVLGRLHDTHFALVSVATPSTVLRMLHVAGDYIPSKIAREKQFYEFEFLKLLRHFHQPGGLVVDVGANIGNHTLYFSRVMGAQVAAFEPEPHNLVCLELNLRLNGVQQRVVSHRVALGAGPGAISLSMGIKDNFGSFSSTPAANPNSRPGEQPQATRVPVYALDDLLQRHHAGHPVSIIKIDVEGMELAVLQGAQQTIRLHRPVVACECFSKTEFARVEEFLGPLGYTAVAMLNATPTFIFICSDSPLHQTRLAQHARDQALERASKSKGFRGETTT